ncbi:MAG: hypothetical protein CBC35_12090 [Planctomycetes bacterium TMED75]|nr:hypothetical protein [Planctomycetaceae bacterium]OUU90468.1 MAG: hypothetical protein CBC35_12090 [Planctomycetes bacterium TMED75]
MSHMHNSQRTVTNADHQSLRLTEPLRDMDEIPLSEFSENSLRALAAVEDVSRRIEDLASTLGCLGFFDSTDGPRAA